MGEATFLRDSDKIPELMNLHRGQSAGSNALSKALADPGPSLPNLDSPLTARLLCRALNPQLTPFHRLAM